VARGARWNVKRKELIFVIRELNINIIILIIKDHVIVKFEIKVKATQFEGLQVEAIKSLFV